MKKSSGSVHTQSLLQWLFGGKQKQSTQSNKSCVRFGGSMDSTAGLSIAND
jgi:hypothetical protein